VPVCSTTARGRLARLADRIVCLVCPHNLYAIGVWYRDFTQTTDREVLELLHRVRSRTAMTRPATKRPAEVDPRRPATTATKRAAGDRTMVRGDGDSWT
jgi:putative phosphoribosyl transferase